MGIEEGLQLDGSVPVRHWPVSTHKELTGPPELRPDVPNGKIDPHECLSAAYKELEEKYFSKTSLNGGSLHLYRASAYSCLPQKAQERRLPPWFIDDGKNGGVDDVLRMRIDLAVRETQLEGHITEREGDVRYLTDFLLKTLTKAKKDDGLGLTYQNKRAYYARNAIDTYEEGVGACHGFSFIFYALAKRAGLNPVFIRITHIPEEGNRELFHIGVAVRLDPSKGDQLTALDPSTGKFLSEGSQWYPISHLEMMAYQTVNQAIVEAAPEELNASERFLQQRALFKRAESYAPHNFEVLRNIGVFYNKHGRSDIAERYFARARAINPSIKAYYQ
jgi:tetratricopeptide (TPR) repeat protein